MIRKPLVIIGGKGMLGQALAQAFSDVDPIVWDRADIDITDATLVKKKFAKVHPRTVINAAAYNNVDAAEDEGRDLAYLVNTEGPQVLAQACKAIGARLVHYSTDYVFDGDTTEPYTEDDEPNPQSEYARSKHGGELVVQDVGGEYCIIRTCRLFGAPGTSDQSKKSFVDLMLTLAQSKDHLDIVDEEIASPTYIDDLAAQTRVLLEGTAVGEYPSGIYHATNTGYCTWYEFAQEIFRLAHINIDTTPVPANMFPRPAKRPAFSALANTTLPPMRSWQEALQDYLEHR